MSNLRSIVYASSATELMSAAQLESLLIDARGLNLQNAITGILLYSEGTFMQCFEGEAQAMVETYDRIRNSRKHKGILELWNEPLAKRSFPDWQMGLAQISQTELTALSTACWKSQMDEANGSTVTSPGFRLLQGFWKRSLRQASRL